MEVFLLVCELIFFFDCILYSYKSKESLESQNDENWKKLSDEIK